MKNRALSGHISCFLAYAIFGINIIICKDISGSSYLSPIALFALRCVGAATLLWIVSCFFPKEKVEKKDYIRIFIASMLGLLFNQVSFLTAVKITTPLNISMITILSPIFTMLIAAVAIKERLSLMKIAGVLISFLGIFLLTITSPKSSSITTSHPMGIALMVLATSSFALYLGIFKPLIAKYSTLTFMKWMFLFSAVVAVPFSIKDFMHVPYAEVPAYFYLELLFFVYMATLAYFLIPIGQKFLRPTSVSLYSYLQPIIASVFSIYIGMDVLTWQKLVAIFVVVIGVVLVNISKR